LKTTRINNKESSIADLLLRWYKEHGRDFPWRRNTSDPYKILVTELLLQRTKAEMVARIWDKFFKKFPTIHSLAKADEAEVLEIIQELGLRYRVKRLKMLAVQAVQKFGGIPRTLNDLLTLPGIGPYIASAVLCFAFNVPVPVVDANVMRLMNRFRGYTDELSVRNYLRGVIPNKGFKEFNWALIDLASLVCTSRSPRCPECPLNLMCPKIKVDKSKWRVLRKRIKGAEVELILQPYSTSRRMP